MSLEEHWNRLAVHFKRRRRTAHLTQHQLNELM